MIVRDAQRVLPGVDDIVSNLHHTLAMFHLREDERPVSAHPPGVPLHHVQICANRGGQVGFIDDKQITLSDARASFARDLVAPGDIDHLDGVIGQFATEAGGQIVAPGFQEKKIRAELCVQFLQSHQVGGNIFANRRMGATAGFHGANALGGKRIVSCQKLAVFPREDVVGHGRQAQFSAQLPAELKHERGLPAPHRTTHADREGAFAIVPVQREIPVVEMTGSTEMLVSVMVGTVIVGMGRGMTHRSKMKWPPEETDGRGGTSKNSNASHFGLRQARWISTRQSPFRSQGSTSACRKYRQIEEVHYSQHEQH